MTKERDWLTTEEAAERTGHSPAYIREILNRAQYDKSIKLRGTKCGKEWRIDEKSVNEYLGIDINEKDYKKDLYIKELEGKVKELLEDTQIDEGRIASEIVIFADKICTDEEVVRLRSHVEHMKATLQSDDSGIGRKLDFIAQEMNREANTILSKANDLETSNIGIELKTEIEKVREQIQNIE